MMRRGTTPTAAQFAAAALVAQGFSLYLMLLAVVAPPTATQWERADPILALVPPTMVPWLISLTGLASASVWWLLVRPDVATLRHGIRDAGVGLAVGLSLITALRLSAGPSLPAFVPPEEGAAPGLLLSLAAAHAEETLFRLILLPAVLLGLPGPPALRATLATAASGLAFAWLHDPTLDVLSGPFFATRFLIPGCAFSAAALLVSPAFVVTAHCAAHLLLPRLFA